MDDGEEVVSGGTRNTTTTTSGENKLNHYNEKTVFYVKKEVLHSLRERLKWPSIILFCALLALTFALIVWSHTAFHAKINLEFYSLSSTSEFKHLSSETLTVFNIIHLGWQSSAYMVATFLVLFVVVLPYVLLVILLIIFCCKFRQNQRRRALVFSIFLCKFSLVFVFLLMFMSDVLDFTIDYYDVSSSTSSVGEMSFDYDSGIQVFASAIIFLMISFLVCFFIHRLHFSHLNNVENQSGSGSQLEQLSGDIEWDVRGADANLDDDDDETLECCSENYPSPVICGSFMYSQGSGWSTCCAHFWKRFALVCILIACVIFLVWSYSATLVVFEFSGVLSPFMVQSEYSYKLGNVVSASGNPPGFLNFVYIMFIVVCPLLTLTLLMVLWCVPVPRCLNKKLRIWIWCCFSFSAIDVVWITTFIIGYDMGRYLRYLFRTEFFADFCGYFVELVEHQCPSVSGYYREGFLSALLVCVGLWVIVIYSVFYTNDRKKENKNNEEVYPLVNDNELSFADNTFLL